jgi:hypothetical protein
MFSQKYIFVSLVRYNSRAISAILCGSNKIVLNALETFLSISQIKVEEKFV